MTEIVNIIESTNGAIETITSFTIHSANGDTSKQVIVKQAEEKFIECVRANHCCEDDFSDIEILDEDNYTNSMGYEVSIIWSHNVVADDFPSVSVEF